MPVIDLRGFLYVLPVKAVVKVVDSAFHAKGDVNWDGIIDSKDLELLKAAYGAHPGDPNWNPDCDLNGDGFVDGKDITLVSIHMGNSAPTYVTPAKAEVMDGKVVVIGTFGTQTLKREFIAGTRVAFIFTALGLWGRTLIVPI